jgi:hypothetical protein
MLKPARAAVLRAGTGPMTIRSGRAVPKLGRNIRSWAVLTTVGHGPYGILHSVMLSVPT